MNFLEMNGLQTAQTHFKDIFQNNIHRDYADAMLDWLEQETDFFTAPSSTKYHGAHPGGLLVHSLNVYYRLRNIAIRDLADKEDPGKCRLSEEQEETVAVIALLHDVCKVGCYHTETKRRKNPETGRWEDYEGYTYKDPLPLGHGEKSLYLIQRHMVLLPEEALAIRWHMGAYDDAAKADSRAMAAAMKKELCKPCAIALEGRGKTVKAAGGRCEKITCAECGRRRFGYTYEVTGWPTHRKKEDKLT